MKVNKVMVLFSALMLCMGVFFSPVTAYAKTDKDETPPTVTAEVRGETLHIEASDEQSGVEAVFVDGNKITALVNGVADVPLKDYAGNGSKVNIYAVDYAGNKSGTVQVDNPYYQAPVPLTPPTEPVAQEPEQPSESAVPDSSGTNPFTPDGAGEVLDAASDGDGKEFYTITTPDGFVYYLVIDHQRDSDNVYFLNAVTEADLMGLTSSGTVPGESAVPTPEPEPVPEPEPDDTDAEPEPEQEEGTGIGTILFVLLAVAAIGGAGWYFKIYKPKQQAAMDAEDEYDGDDEEDDLLSDGDDYDFDAEENYQTAEDVEFEDD